VVFANGDVNLIDAEGTARTRLLAIRALPRVTADLELHAWPQQGCFWRRHAYEQVGGLDHSLTFCMDRDLFLRLVRRGPARRIPGPPLADFRVHDAMKSVRLPDVWRRERAQLVTRHGSPRRNSRSRRLLLLTVWYAMVAARWLRWRGIKLGLEL
jgi:hypothetical protein